MTKKEKRNRKKKQWSKGVSQWRACVTMAYTDSRQSRDARHPRPLQLRTLATPPVGNIINKSKNINNYIHNSRSQDPMSLFTIAPQRH